MNNFFLNEIAAGLENLKSNSEIHRPQNFIPRSNALDQIEFLLAHFEEPDDALRMQALEIKSSLEEIDRSLFLNLRSQLKNSKDKGGLLQSFMEEYCVSKLSEIGDEDYDETDLCLNNLLSTGGIPDETLSRDPEMVFYQKTPARIILELIYKAQLTADDVFFDIGSGLGQANILVRLLTPATSIGIEYEPAFCRYAQEQAAALNLDNIQFINADARHADYSQGTGFFMYTPFIGNMLREVLNRIRQHSKGRKIKLFTYGPCTAEVAEQDWLVSESNKLDTYTLAIFTNTN